MNVKGALLYVINAGADFNAANLLHIYNRDNGKEARGFRFGPPIALAIGAKFVSLRKLMLSFLQAKEQAT